MRFVLLFFCTTLFASSWEEEKKFYDEHDYLWLKGFFSNEQVKLLKGWADDVDFASKELLSCSEKTGQSLAYLIRTMPGVPVVVQERANPKMACRAEDFIGCCPDLYQMVVSSISSYMGRVQGEPYILFKDKINFKWPGGGAFMSHQDFPAYEFLGPREHMTAMICIDDATLENGCLNVALGWKEEFAGEEFMDNGRMVFPFIVGGREHGAIEQKYVDRIRWLPLTAKAGDVVLFSSFIPHYSEVNASQAPRRAMFFTFNRMREGDYRPAYYHAKRSDPDNPIFHIGTPTKAKGK